MARIGELGASHVLQKERPDPGFHSNKRVGNDIMRYAIVIEKAENNFSAYVPDLPGCVATGGSVEEVEMTIKEAIAFHLEGMREDGITPSTPRIRENVEVAA